MSARIIEFAELQRLTGYQRQADVARCLRDQGIRFACGRDGIWTTIDAVNAALGIVPKARNDGTYDPEAA